MIKRIVASALLSAIVIGLSGCSAAPKPISKALIKIEPMTVEFPKIDPVTLEQLSFANLDFSNQITELSKYKKYRLVKRYDSLRDYKGVQTKKHNNVYSISYINRTQGSGSYMHESIATFDIMFEEKDNVITFKYPSSYQYIEETGFIANPLLSSLDNLENDSKKIFSKLNTISISKHISFKGEINSKYPAQSIYANFKRMVGNYSYRNNEKITESKKQNTFNLNVNGKNLPLYVEVFPYREGSKVKYSTTLSYRITQNGSNLTKQDIDNIKVKIAQIVND